ncbi:MAG: hypothetical protein RBG1_1C00001G0372 [candidate division Zixibacteria bacterium RBG-1]|nr:MAG: hypothetical protein RBG1_1C00001G0372 [candidate division Zixibacteria bacterium RBG-1]
MGFSSHKLRVVLLYILLGNFFWVSAVSADSPEEKIFRYPTENLDLNNLKFPFKTESKRKKIGLALSGGGARGLAQIGILKVLERENISIDYIAGTSIGGIVGGLYAAGFSAPELEKIALENNWTDLLKDTPSRLSLLFSQREESQGILFQFRFDGFKPYIPQALTGAQKFTNFLSRLTLEANYRAQLNFDNLKIPFRSVCTDLVTGEKVVLDSGDLAWAMRATMAAPLAFTPVEWEEKLLVDGGLVDPIPVDVVKQMGADIVIAVNTSSVLAAKEQILTPLDIAAQSTSVMTLEKKQQSLSQAQVVISPQLKDFTTMDFDKAKLLIESGEKVAEKLLPQLKLILENEIEIVSETPKYKIDQVNFEGNEKLDLGYIEWLTPWCNQKIAAISTSDSISEEGIIKNLEKLYDSGYFQQVEARLQKNGDNLTLTYLLKENPELENIVFEGRLVRESIPNPKGNPALGILNYQNLEKILAEKQNEYKKKGYSLINFRQISYDPNRKSLNVEVDEGIISRIKYAGNQSTKNWVLNRNFPLKENQPFNSRLANQGLANLHNTGLFEQTSLSLLPTSEGPAIELKVKEKKYNLIRGGVHYQDEYHSEGFLQLGNSNLAGTGDELFLHLQYGDRKQVYKLNLKGDRIFKTYLTYKLSLGYKKEERNLILNHKRIGFLEEERSTLNFSFGENIFKLGKISWEAKAERIVVRNSVTDSSEAKNLRSLIFKSTFDNLNKYPFPTQGSYHQIYLELAAKVLQGDFSHSKFFFSSEAYLSITERLNIHPKFSLGLSDRNLPFSEKFPLGGSRSFYGYYTDEKQGNKFLLLNLEARVKTAKRVYWSVRYDLGETWEKEKLRAKELKSAWGVKFSLDTPLGPLELAYGRAVFKQDKWYLNLGLFF